MATSRRLEYGPTRASSSHSLAPTSQKIYTASTRHLHGIYTGERSLFLLSIIRHLRASDYLAGGGKTRPRKSHLPHEMRHDRPYGTRKTMGAPWRAPPINTACPAVAFIVEGGAKRRSPYMPERRRHCASSFRLSPHVPRSPKRLASAPFSPGCIFEDPARYRLAVSKRTGHGHVCFHIAEAGLLQGPVGRDVMGVRLA